MEEVVQLLHAMYIIKNNLRSIEKKYLVLPLNLHSMFDHQNNINYVQRIVPTDEDLEIAGERPLFPQADS